VTRRHTVSAIAAEVGMSRPAVDLALSRHGVTRIANTGDANGGRHVTDLVERHVQRIAPAP
jgi:hypothetical protein